MYIHSYTPDPGLSMDSGVTTVGAGFDWFWMPPSVFLRLRTMSISTTMSAITATPPMTQPAMLPAGLSPAFCIELVAVLSVVCAYTRDTMLVAMISNMDFIFFMIYISKY